MAATRNALGHPFLQPSAISLVHSFRKTQPCHVVDSGNDSTANMERYNIIEKYVQIRFIRKKALV